jgi:hypothetical protein
MLNEAESVKPVDGSRPGVLVDYRTWITARGLSHAQSRSGVGISSKVAPSFEMEDLWPPWASDLFFVGFSFGGAVD